MGRTRARGVRKLFLLGIALATALSVACAPLAPAAGGLGGLSPAQEIEVGRRAAQDVAREIGLYRDPALATWIEALGERIAAHAPPTGYRFRFAVVDMDEPNAFALPGGYVYISRGLLALANSEDEVANVIGHEIAHVVGHHASARRARATQVGLLSLLGVIAAAVLGGGQAASLASQIGQVAGAGLIASYSRDQEREADRAGQRFAALAGANPAALASILRRLEALERLQQGGPRLPSFLDSHPSTPERVAAAAARAAAQGGGAPRRPDPAYLRRIDGLLVGPNPAEGSVVDGRFVHVDLGFSFDLPSGWEVNNRHDALLLGDPSGGAYTVVEIQGSGSDPAAAARVFLARQGWPLLEPPRPLGGARLPAYHAVAQAPARGGQAVADLSWVAWEGKIYRFVGLAAPSRYPRLRSLLTVPARTMRPLRPGEARAVRALRVRAVRARAGESLAELVGRSGDAWSLQETAIRNDLSPEARLTAGTWIKIARSEPYRRIAGPGAR